ncbi:Hypothetical_protein [Hexamita inflata]|uniref:Hypothetical_protein n=1 Tax=Hexamita inflata TaxID=28002 RepID=A0AA86P0J9_9EUKA|nr:Hypothetical protein HINF_LOCUS17284 [Hexamita inflata]
METMSTPYKVLNFIKKVASNIISSKESKSTQTIEQSNNSGENVQNMNQEPVNVKQIQQIRKQPFSNKEQYVEISAKQQCVHAKQYVNKQDNIVDIDDIDDNIVDID